MRAKTILTILYLVSLGVATIVLAALAEGAARVNVLAAAGFAAAVVITLVLQCIRVLRFFPR